MDGLFATVLLLLAIVLILLVLVQRGRGGGLAGALGGMGGSSAFGAKAGDVFTRITIYVAVVWITVCIAAEYWGSHRKGPLSGSGTGVQTQSLGTQPQSSNDDAASGAAGPMSTTPEGTNSGAAPADGQ